MNKYEAITSRMNGINRLALAIIEQHIQDKYDQQIRENKDIKTGAVPLYNLVEILKAEHTEEKHELAKAMTILIGNPLTGDQVVKIRHAIDTLSRTQKDVIELTYGLSGENCCDTEEIARILHLSRDIVYQYERSAIRELCRLLATNELLLEI